MLKNIHVRNFALIDEVEIDLAKGLNILTGETGAGKSIIIDAVNFALGQRASKDVVRSDADYALSELVFSVEGEELRRKLTELDITVEDDEIIFQRKISGGKTTSRINGETVTASVLKDIAAQVIDIHGQHDNQSLLNKSRHIALLDSLLEDRLSNRPEKLAECYVNYTNKLSELEELSAHAKDKDKELVFLKYQTDEIDAASLKVGEDEELESVYRKMLNSRKIAESIYEAHSLTGYDNEGAGSLVGRALSRLRNVSDLDKDANDLQLILTDIDGLLNDFNRAVADYEASLEFSEEDFDDVETRINILNTLKSKYGGTIEAVLSFRDKAAEDIEKLMDIEKSEMSIKVEIDRLYVELLNISREVSNIRKDGARELSASIENALKDLNFLDARFEIKVESDESNISSKGFDNVEMLISTNPGEKLKPLTDVASGGEMSRIMLAVKSVMASRDNIPTLIFDEIDTGISGRTAQKVSEKMGAIAKDHQVICVTHLPQIAAMADTHFEISKEASDGRTITHINRLNEEEEILELARMLGGVSITDAVIENARDMKKQARKLKEKFSSEGYN